MICKYCGHPLKGGEKLCPGCGRELSQETSGFWDILQPPPQSYGSYENNNMGAAVAGAPSRADYETPAADTLSVAEFSTAEAPQEQEQEQKQGSRTLSIVLGALCGVLAASTLILGIVSGVRGSQLKKLESRENSYISEISQLKNQIKTLNMELTTLRAAEEFDIFEDILGDDFMLTEPEPAAEPESKPGFKPGPEESAPPVKPIGPGGQGENSGSLISPPATQGHDNIITVNPNAGK